MGDAETSTLPACLDREIIEGLRNALDQAEEIPGLSEAGRMTARGQVARLLGEEEFAGTPAWSPARALKSLRHQFGESGGVNASVCRSTTFTVMTPEIMRRMFGGELPVGDGEDGCYLYGRHLHPNSIRFGRRAGAMEGMETGYPTASGMAAISCTLDQLLVRGDHMVASGAVYGGTRAFMENMLMPDEQKGVNIDFVRPSNTEGFVDAIKPGTKVVYAETVANPTMDIVNIPALAEAGRKVGAIVVIDNTFAPLTFSPALWGADIVVHSTTKFISGASDEIGGVVCCSGEFLGRMMDLHSGQLMLRGPVMGANEAHTLDLRLNHLPLRIKAHSAEALEFAKRIEVKGMKVYYPGLESHPQHELATAMMNPEYGYGGMMSIDFGTLEKAETFVKKLQELGGGWNAVSLGYFDTLVSIPGTTTSSEIDEGDREAVGVTPGLVRLSIGFTGDCENEWEKMEQAIDFAMAS